MILTFDSNEGIRGVLCYFTKSMATEFFVEEINQAAYVSVRPYHLFLYSDCNDVITTNVWKQTYWIRQQRKLLIYKDVENQMSV